MQPLSRTLDLDTFIYLPVTCGLDDNRRANRLVAIAAVVFMILLMNRALLGKSMKIDLCERIPICK